MKKSERDDAGLAARAAAPSTSFEAIERAVVGALRSAIKDHGPITPDKISSAAKRVLGNLANAGVEVPPARL